MQTFTHIPLPNTLAAKRYISEYAQELVFAPINYHLFASQRLPDGLLIGVMIDIAVTLFMQAHPRGKGTKGHDIKRRFYAACHTIKAEASKTRSVKNMERQFDNARLSKLSKGARGAPSSLSQMMCHRCFIRHGMERRLMGG